MKTACFRPRTNRPKAPHDLHAHPIYTPVKGQPRGFTAIELMVVIAIVTILAALAAPSFKPLIQRWRVRDAREALTSSIYLARSEAIRRGGGVVLRKNPLTAAGCPQAFTAQEWSCGWSVVDTNARPNQQIQTFSPPPGSIDVMINPTGSNITFDRWGMTAGIRPTRFSIAPEPEGISSSLTTVLCLSSGGSTRYLTDDVVCR